MDGRIVFTALGPGAAAEVEKWNARRAPSARKQVDAPLREAVAAYFRGDYRPLQALPTAFLQATPFQLRVWRMLARIPPGQVHTYGQLAAAVNLPHGSRAVGQALGRNPIPLLFPCHRVVNADGRLGGFRDGPEVKKQLLEAEGHRVSEHRIWMPPRRSPTPR